MFGTKVAISTKLKMIFYGRFIFNTECTECIELHREITNIASVKLCLLCVLCVENNFQDNASLILFAIISQGTKAGVLVSVMVITCPFIL